MVAKTRKKIEEFYNYRPSYLKRSANDVAGVLPYSIDDIETVRKQMRLTVFPSNYTKVKVKQKIKTLKKEFVKHIKSYVKDNPVKPEFKRLFWDIETSYNIVSSWRVGYKINLSHDNIIKERAIICICYKWEGDSKVHSLQWNKGDDSKMIKDFINIINSADESIGHNSDRFDEKWLRARALYHGVSMWPKYQTLDTLKVSRAGFNFNSNKLDYLGKFMGFNGKLETGGLKLWDDIIQKNDTKAMNQMIEYCKRDVELLEKVYVKLSNYAKPKTHVGVVIGKSKCSCPHCGSNNVVFRGSYTSAAGTVSKVVNCKDCFKHFSINATTWNVNNKLNMKK